ncbi:hypothetical protein [Microlunatus soli]|uniref:hypothetical protein n=1 Tax=Microlunatus soli TaxID=630515 RepID=UPI0012F9C560|nr:hypothetical protein [Microlunatus soli]
MSRSPSSWPPRDDRRRIPAPQHRDADIVLEGPGIGFGGTVALISDSGRRGPDRYGWGVVTGAAALAVVDG